MARGAESLGYTDLWSTEDRDVDGFTRLVPASQWTPGLRLGCALLPVQTRGPALMALSVAGLRYFEAGVDTVIAGLLERAMDPHRAARLIAPRRP